jgi:hypothetical protein
MNLALLLLGLLYLAPTPAKALPPSPEETLCRLLWLPQTPKNARAPFLSQAEDLATLGQPRQAAENLDQGLADLLATLKTAFSAEATTWKQGRRALDQELSPTGPAALRGDLFTLKPWALARAQKVYCLAGTQAQAFQLSDAALRDWGTREHLVNRLLLTLRFGRLDEAERLAPAAPTGYRETAAAAWLQCLRGHRTEALAQDLYRAARLCGDDRTRQGLELMEEKCRP